MVDWDTGDGIGENMFIWFIFFIVGDGGRLIETVWKSVGSRQLDSGPFMERMWIRVSIQVIWMFIQLINYLVLIPISLNISVSIHI